jgi:PKD repeat protein
MNRKLFLIIVLLLFFKFDFSHVFAASDYQVEGFVTRFDGSLVSGAQILLYLGEDIIGEDKTGRLGFYRIQFQSDPDVVYILTCTKDGFDPAETTFTTGDDSTININFDLNSPPIANIDGEYSGSIGEPISFSSAGSFDPDGDEIFFYWDFGDGSSSEEENPTHSYDQPEEYNVVLTITDIHGSQSSVQKKCTIRNNSPIANANGPYYQRVSFPVLFNSTGSIDPDGVITVYHWDFGDGTMSDQENPTHVYDSEGTYTVVLTVTDEFGEIGIDETKCEILVNVPPKADPGGPYTGYVGMPVQFDSTGSSDIDGEIISYEWNFDDGSTSDEQNPIHIFTKKGTYEVELTVIDSDNDSNKGKTSCVIDESELMAPIAEANGPYSAYERDTIVLSSAGSHDIDGEIVSFLWNFGDGETSTEEFPAHSYRYDGTYTVTLTVTDNDGLMHSDTTTSSIKEKSRPSSPSPPAIRNKKPIAEGNGPYKGNVGEPVQFNSSGSYDPDGEIEEYDWSFGDGTNAMEENPSHIYEASGTYIVILTVKDDEGSKNRYETECVIEEPNEPPTPIHNGPYFGKTNETIVFSSEGSYDLDGSITKLYWVFGDGTTIINDVPDNYRIEHSYKIRGTYDVLLTLTDDRGFNSTIQTICKIKNNLAPEVQINGPYEGMENQEISFSSIGSQDQDGKIIEYLWDFGDGTSSNQKNVLHLFPEPKTYNVTLSIRDNNGAETKKMTICDIKINEPPIVVINGPYTGYMNAPILFQSEGSNDPDGEIVEYEWLFGDGKLSVDSITNHTYVEVGVYEVVLSITDEYGKTNSELTTATISEEPKSRIPIITLTAVGVLSAYVLFARFVKIQIKF